MKRKLATLVLLTTAYLGCADHTRLHVNPLDAMVYEPVHVRITGVPDEQTVTVRAAMVDSDSVRWESVNRFRPRDGVVDLAEHAPVSGTYDVASRMGFVWSMTPAENDTGRPLMFATSSLEPSTIDLTVHVGDETLERRLTRRTLRPGVRRVEVREDGLVGTLFLPENASELPAVVILGGSGGGLEEREVALLASEGYVTLALAYFEAEGLPETLSNIPLEYFDTGIEYLQGLPEVDADRIAVLGASRGGELALLLGATFRQIKGVIAIVGSGLVWRSCCPPGDDPAWTLGGEPVPHMTATADSELERRFFEDLGAGKPVAWAPVARSMMERELARRSDAIIAVERTNGPILMLSGAEDALWPSGPLSEVARQRLELHDFPFPYEHISYPDAGHSFPPPYMPATLSQNPNRFLRGGSTEGTARAMEEAWRRILEFLDESLRHDR